MKILNIKTLVISRYVHHQVNYAHRRHERTIDIGGMTSLTHRFLDRDINVIFMCCGDMA